MQWTKKSGWSSFENRTVSRPWPPRQRYLIASVRSSRDEELLRLLQRGHCLQKVGVPLTFERTIVPQIEESVRSLRNRRVCAISIALPRRLRQLRFLISNSPSLCPPTRCFLEIETRIPIDLKHSRGRDISLYDIVRDYFGREYSEEQQLNQRR